MNRLGALYNSIPTVGTPKRKRMFSWAAVLVLLFVAFFVLSGVYLNFVRDTIRRDAKGTLAELGDHIAQSIYHEIDGTKDVLGSLALEIARDSLNDEDRRLTFLKEQSAFWNFYDMAVIDANGISHHQDGTKDTPMNRALLSQALNSGEMTYDFLIAGGEDCVIFFVPLPEEVRRSTGLLAISGTYAVHNWDLLMDIRLFNAQAVTQIITRDGVVITRGRENQNQPSYNFLDTLNTATFELDVTLDEVRASLRADESLHLSYTTDGTEYYLNCSPIGFNGWSLAFTVPTFVVNSAGYQMARSVLIISAGLTLVFLVIFVLFAAVESRAQKQIWNAAYLDEVTGGANRHKFMLDAQALLERSATIYTLVYANIDQFKMLNERYSTTGADYILRSLHSAYVNMLTDKECCARLAADHFVLLLQAEGVQERLTKFAQEQAVQPTLDGGTCQIRLTFGLCPVAYATRELTALIDRANLAMKTSPMMDNGIATYNSAMMAKAARDKALTERLLQKSVQNEFFIHLQPKVELSTGRVIGAEALARWTSPEFGAVSPGEFIPLCEKAGIVCQIDWIAFDHVCRLLSKWMREGTSLIPISFNLSKAQLNIPDFLEHYRRIIAKYAVPCKYLDFEFTESILYENSGKLQMAVNDIHAMGAHCSVDDFGFGYSSLGLLGQFEADTLKLDRSFFLEDAQQDSRTNRIVSSVIQIAASLGMHTVAEGVEDEKYVEMLRQFGCGSVQGYYFSKPLPVEEFINYMNERHKEEYL